VPGGREAVCDRPSHLTHSNEADFHFITFSHTSPAANNKLASRDSIGLVIPVRPPNGSDDNRQWDRTGIMAKLQFRNLSPSIGAEVIGFDPSADNGDEIWQELSKAFDDRALLVFRDIDVTPEQQRKIAEVLYVGGDMSRVPEDNTGTFSLVSNKEPGGGSPYGRLLFHTDMMWSDRAEQVPTLYAMEAVQPSVPTMFVSTTHGWKTLPDELKARVADLKARHQSGPQGRGKSAYEAELIQPQWEKLHDTVTPVAMAHPRTGETMLYVGDQHTREIVGLSRDESDALLDELYEHLYRPELVVEHHWRTGDLVIWDNLAAQHARAYVKGDGPARTLRKIHAPRDMFVGYGKASTYAAAPALG
jgi:alpha-ketoglutarate-dependent taurine dioxygenase